jgi:hypothetical protein
MAQTTRLRLEAGWQVALNLNKVLLLRFSHIRNLPNILRFGGLRHRPARSPHTFGNPADTQAVILCTVTPDLYLDYFRELDRLPKSPGGLDHAAVAEIMKRYATEAFLPSN